MMKQNLVDYWWTQWESSEPDTKRNEQCYYGWLYFSTDSSKLTPIGDGAALLKPSARWVNAPAPDSLYHSSPQRSLLRSVLSPIRSCSSCLFPSRVFNQIASTTNLFSPIFYIIQSFPWTETYLKTFHRSNCFLIFPTSVKKIALILNTLTFGNIINLPQQYSDIDPP